MAITSASRRRTSNAEDWQSPPPYKNMIFNINITVVWSFLRSVLPVVRSSMSYIVIIAFCTRKKCNGEFWLISLQIMNIDRIWLGKCRRNRAKLSLPRFRTWTGFPMKNWTQVQGNCAPYSWLLVHVVSGERSRFSNAINDDDRVPIRALVTSDPKNLHIKSIYTKYLLLLLAPLAGGMSNCDNTSPEILGLAISNRLYFKFARNYAILIMHF